MAIRRERWGAVLWGRLSFSYSDHDDGGGQRRPYLHCGKEERLRARDSDPQEEGVIDLLRAAVAHMDMLQARTDHHEG